MASIRLLVVKTDLDGHERDILFNAQEVQGQEIEVIYINLHNSPGQIADRAVQEDVNIIGLSSSSGAHNTLFPMILEELEKRNREDIPVIACGEIPDEDISFLLENGIKKVFTSDSTTEEIVLYIKQLLGADEKLAEPKQIAHIGIAVHKLEDALPFYTDAIGLVIEAIEQVESEGVKIAFLKVGETRIELLEPLNEKSAIKGFLDKRGEGIHHIAFEVEDIDARLSLLKEKGIRLINEEAKEGAHQSQIAFIHPKEANGVLVELCEQAKGSEE